MSYKRYWEKQGQKTELTSLRDHCDRFNSKETYG